jgi:hypothetical protein
MLTALKSATATGIKPRQALFGALGGVYGAAIMSLVRLAMRRAGASTRWSPRSSSSGSSIGRAWIRSPGRSLTS